MTSLVIVQDLQYQILVAQVEEEDGRPQLPRGEKTLTVCPVGLDSDKILAARKLIGEKAARLRLSYNLEVRSQCVTLSLASLHWLCALLEVE